MPKYFPLKILKNYAHTFFNKFMRFRALWSQVTFLKKF